MKTLTTSLFLVCAAAGLTAPYATSAPVHGSLALSESTEKDLPERPGGGKHFSRGATKLDNSGHPVTGQGPNKATKPLNDALEAAGVR